MKRKEFIRSSSILGLGSLISTQVAFSKHFGFRKSPKITFMILSGGIRQQDFMQIAPAALPASFGIISTNVKTISLSHTVNLTQCLSSIHANFGSKNQHIALDQSVFKSGEVLKQLLEVRSNNKINNIVLESGNSDIAHSSKKSYYASLSTYHSWLNEFLSKPRKNEIFVVISTLGRNLKPNSCNDGSGGGFDHCDENARIQSAMVLANLEVLAKLSVNSSCNSMNEFLEKLKTQL